MSSLLNMRSRSLSKSKAKQPTKKNTDRAQNGLQLGRDLLLQQMPKDLQAVHIFAHGQGLAVRDVTATEGVREKAVSRSSACLRDAKGSGKGSKGTDLFDDKL